MGHLVSGGDGLIQAQPGEANHGVLAALSSQLIVHCTVGQGFLLLEILDELVTSQIRVAVLTDEYLEILPRSSNSCVLDNVLIHSEGLLRHPWPCRITA